MMSNRRTLLAAGPGVALATPHGTCHAEATLSARQVVIYAETTGFEPEAGDRLIELVALELDAGTPTGRSFHAYMNPHRPCGDWGMAVHGLPDSFLARKPRFEDLVVEFLAFVGPAPLVAHNAAFVRAFLNAELRKLNRAPIEDGRWICTYELAQRIYPDKYNALSALCKRLQIDTPDQIDGLANARLVAAVHARLIEKADVR